MWFDYFAALICAFAVLSLCYLIKDYCFTEAVGGRNTIVSVEVNDIADGDSLEQTLRGLVWLRESGRLTADVHVIICGDFQQAKYIASSYSSKYDYINCYYGDSSWTNSTN